MLFKISIKYYITIIFSLFSFVKRYAVRNVKIRQYAVRRVKIRQYAVRKGEGGVSPSNSIQDLQNSLDLPYEYCYKWKLHVNVAKTKIMIFRKGLSDNISVKYGDQELEIINRFVYMYLGIVFTAGGSFSDTQSTLVGQALKAIFKLNKCLYKFTAISVKHKLELFDKLVAPIINYGSEAWGFHNGNAIEVL